MLTDKGRFKSQYQHTLDDKGRISFPAKFREQLGTSFVAAKGLQDDCLYIYSFAEWQLIENVLLQNTNNSKEHRDLRRLFLGSAHDLECDKLGRVLLPVNLREHAGLVKDVIIVGVGNKIELWDSSRYNVEYGGKAIYKDTAKALDNLEILI